MARPLRPQVPGGIYHVMSRGVAYLPIYRDDVDRSVFLSTAEEVFLRLGWPCYAYCLMTTHYHLVVRTPKGDIARGMQRLNGHYARSFNRRHRGRGHAFESRYASVLVETEAHLLLVIRYLALNPVQAGLVDDPAAWPWSSYRFLLGLGAPPRFLSARWVLELFGRDPDDARKELADFVLAGLERATAPTPAPSPPPGAPAPAA